MGQPHTHHDPYDRNPCEMKAGTIQGAVRRATAQYKGDGGPGMVVGAWVGNYQAHARTPRGGADGRRQESVGLCGMCLCARVCARGEGSTPERKQHQASRCFGE